MTGVCWRFNPLEVFTLRRLFCGIGLKEAERHIKGLQICLTEGGVRADELIGPVSPLNEGKSVQTLRRVCSLAGEKRRTQIGSRLSQHANCESVFDQNAFNTLLLWWSAGMRVFVRACV